MSTPSIPKLPVYAATVSNEAHELHHVESTGRVVGHGVLQTQLAMTC